MSVETDITDHDRMATLRASLSDEFATLTERLAELTDTTADTAEAHNRAALLVATRQSLAQIADALRRIADGTYGLCEQCDTAIPAERLEVLPHARFCVPCQQKHHG